MAYPTQVLLETVSQGELAWDHSVMTVEAILNLAWLVVTVAGVCLWRFRWKVSRRKTEHRPWLEATAMVCILALLFPVISLTDDLHPEVIPVDAASSKRSLCLLAAHGCRTANANTHAHHSSVFVCVGRPAANLELLSEGPSSQLPLLKPQGSSAVRAGRSPPSFA
jgi:hypothetical protein